MSGAVDFENRAPKVSMQPYGYGSENHARVTIWLRTPPPPPAHVYICEDEFEGYSPDKVVFSQVIFSNPAPPFAPPHATPRFSSIYDRVVQPSPDRFSSGQFSSDIFSSAKFSPVFFRRLCIFPIHLFVSAFFGMVNLSSLQFFAHSFFDPDIFSPALIFVNAFFRLSLFLFAIFYVHHFFVHAPFHLRRFSSACFYLLPDPEWQQET